jgi:hypothetical protein
MFGVRIEKILSKNQNKLDSNHSTISLLICRVCGVLILSYDELCRLGIRERRTRECSVKTLNQNTLLKQRLIWNYTWVALKIVLLILEYIYIYITSDELDYREPFCCLVGAEICLDWPVFRNSSVLSCSFRLLYYLCPEWVLSRVSLRWEFLWTLG